MGKLNFLGLFLVLASFAACAPTDLSKAKDWPRKNYPQIGVESAEVRTKWKDDLLYVQLDLSPTPDGLHSGTSTLLALLKKPLLWVEFKDEEKFSVLEIGVMAGDITRHVDKGGQEIGIGADLSWPCSKQEYLGLKSWTLRWVGHLESSPKEETQR